MTEIRDRAAAAGYEVLKCQPSTHGTAATKCLNGVRVTSVDGKLNSTGIIILKPGLWSPGPDAINVDAHPNSKDLRAAEAAHMDDAGEQERLKSGNSAYVVVGDRLWFTYAPDAKVPRKKFLAIVGKFEGCAPNCKFEAPSTTKPTATGPDLGPPTAKQAAKTLAPIVRRSKIAGYAPVVKGSVVQLTPDSDLDVGASVYATPAGALDSARFDAKAIKEGKPGPKDFAVIGNRVWETYTADAQARFRKAVETAEGCAPKCRFSISSFE